MKRMILTSFLLLWIALLSSCSDWSKTTWQGAYYDGWTEDSNIVYWPIFTTYEGCKSWAINKKSDAYNNYTYCSQDCHDSVDGIPVCKEVIRSWQPLPSSNTFDSYKR